MARLALAASVLLSLFHLSLARSDPAAILLPSDASSTRAAEVLSKPVTAVDGAVGTAETLETIPIEASLIPIGRDFPHHPPFLRRLGRHCGHLRRGHHGGIPRGAVIPYGDDMVVSHEQLRGMGRGMWKGPEWRREVSVEELLRHREMGLPREMRAFPRWHPHTERHHGDHRSLVKRFLDFLNRH